MGIPMSRAAFNALLPTLDLDKREDRQKINQILINEVHGQKKVFDPPQPYRGYSLDGPTMRQVYYRPCPRVVFNGAWHVVELLEPFGM